MKTPYQQNYSGKDALQCIYCHQLKNALRWCHRAMSKFYVYIFGRPSAQLINDAILRLALRGRGYNNCCDPEDTGEAIFVDLFAKTNPKLCIDIGANKGHYSQMLLLKTNADILAFEPLPKAFDILLKLKGDFPNRFEAVNIGIGQRDELLELFYGAEDSELASFSEEVKQVKYVGDHNINMMTVQVISLDSYYKKNLKGKIDSLDLLKIDTEGFEFEVLMGAQQTILELRPKYIQIEYNWHQLFRGRSLKNLSELLDGYSAYQMLPYGGGLIKRDLDRPESNIYYYSNFVFIRNDLSI